MEGLSSSPILENSYNLMQSFIKAVETGNTKLLEELISTKEPIGQLMHETLLTFKHNLKAVLNGAALTYSNGCLEGFNRKIKQIERTAFGYSSFLNEIYYRASLTNEFLIHFCCRPQPQFNFKPKIRGELQHRHVIVHLLL